MEKIADFTSDLSLGDIEKVDDGAKDAIFNNQGIITTEYICNSLRRRKENKMEYLMSLEHIYLEYFTTNQAYKTKVGRC